MALLAPVCSCQVEVFERLLPRRRRGRRVEPSGDGNAVGSQQFDCAGACLRGLVVARCVYTSVPPLCLTQRVGAGTCQRQVYRHSLFCFGGYNGFTVLNDFYEYRFEPLVVPPPTLKSDLMSLVNNQTRSDVTFIVEGQPVYARCAVVARLLLPCDSLACVVV